MFMVNLRTWALLPLHHGGHRQSPSQTHFYWCQMQHQPLTAKPAARMSALSPSVYSANIFRISDVSRNSMLSQSFWAHGLLSCLLLHLLLDCSRNLPLFTLYCTKLLLQDGLNVSHRFDNPAMDRQSLLRTWSDVCQHSIWIWQAEDKQVPTMNYTSQVVQDEDKRTFVIVQTMA